VTQPVLRSSAWQKICKAARLLLQGGPAGLGRKLREHYTYHVDSKWHFVYLQFPLSNEFSRIPASSAVSVRIAEPADMPKIKDELFPVMTGEQTEETKYFDLVGHPDVRCFMAEKEGRLVHYSWVFLDAGSSPLVDTPFDGRLVCGGDAYIGPIFTAPGARGFIYPQVLSNIVRFLKEDPAVRRIVVLVQGKNPAAVSFYKRIGFSEIPDAQRRPFWSRLGAALIGR